MCIVHVLVPVPYGIVFEIFLSYGNNEKKLKKTSHEQRGYNHVKNTFNIGHKSHDRS